MKKFQKGEVLEIPIERMAFGGKGIGKAKTEKGDLVVFVPNTIPGQFVKCRVVKSRKNHVETKLLEVLRSAPEELDLPYQAIPGAPYARLPIDIQEKYKKETSIDLIRRIGGIQDIAEKFDSFISSPTHWHYRNKMEYAFAAIRYDIDTSAELDEFALGFKHRGTWWMVENLDGDSGLFDQELESSLKEIRKFCENSGLPPWHAPKKQGFFRFLTVRKSFSEDRILLNLVTTEHGLEKFDMKAFTDLLKSLLGERLAGLIHTVNNDIGDRVQPLDGSSRTIYGDDHITEELDGLKFEIRMESFFQTNPGAAELLYKKAISYLDQNSQNGDRILDLFCGTGTISQLVARKLPDSKVIGVDIETQAILDAAQSAKLNKIENVEFHALDVGKFMQSDLGQEPVKHIILDPPRAGIAPKSLAKVIGINAENIVYISCNPATLARDTRTLHDAGYELQKLSLVDQFPHTAHVEAVTLFKKN